MECPYADSRHSCKEGWKSLPAEARREGEIPGKLELYDGELRPVINADRQGWWRFNDHYDRNGYCDNPGRGY
jgi:hypothetical protein